MAEKEIKKKSVKADENQQELADMQAEPKNILATHIESSEYFAAKEAVTLEEVMSLVVFLRDRTGIHFTLEDAPLTCCESLIHLVIQEQNLPVEAVEVFSLWLVSPILELRLKKDHNPFVVVQKWDHLCAMYTDASEKEILESEPVLMFQRDVFLTREKEQQIKDEQILFYLYNEGKYNVIEGRYILHEEDYHTLAGIQAMINFGVFDSAQHVVSEYKFNLEKFYPIYMYVQSRFSFFNRSSISSTPCEQLFMEAHKKESAEHAGTRVILKEYYRKYLQVLWTYPFYGGAFFFGSVEPKANRLRKLIASMPLMKVNICINTDGVAVFNGQKEELLIYVPYSQLSWNYRDLPWDGDSDPLPTLMMQFLCDEQSAESPGKPVTKLLQIFSHEAKLMNALIETCVDRKLALKNNVGNDFTDGPLDIAEKKLLNKLNKLTLETYTQDGEQLSID